jgi:lysophospholipase L1-like esterase
MNVTEKKMKAGRALFFILFVIFMLGMLSYLFPKDGISYGNRYLYFPSLEEIMITEDVHDISQRLQIIEESLRMQDSLQIAYQDSITFYMNFFRTHPSRVYFPNDDWSFFSSLFERLDSCKEKGEIIRILHYGDSQIEGDRITGYIRQQLQEKFGGAGPGLVPAVQPIPSAAINQTASENIGRYIIAGNFANQVSHNRYGVLGQMAQVAGDASVSIAARNWKSTFKNVKEFSKVRLYTGRAPGNFNASLFPSDSVLHKSNQTKRGLNVITWDMHDPVKKFTLRLSGAAEIYGIAIDGDYGVAVDNIPLRGSSGTFFTRIEKSIMRPMLEDLNVGLIILEFGGNMMPSIKGEKNVLDYKVKMTQQIAYFKELCPNSKILLIGPSDMSTKQGGKLQTYPFLEAVVQGMKDAALESGAAFWDMYEVMGGRNSMISWVKNKPSLAAPDYIHFTPKGADRIAELFYESLMIYYDYYNFQRDHEKKIQNATHL